MSFVRRQGPLYVASLAAILILLEYFTVSPELDLVKDTLVTWSTILVAFGTVFAFLTLLRAYANPWITGTRQSRDDKIMNIGFWIFFIILAVLILVLGRGDSFVRMWYDGWRRAPLSTKWGLWACYMVWSTYRIFKARDWGTLVFAVSMMLWLTKNSPSGFLIPGVEESATWLINYPSKGGIRAGTIAYGLGAVVVGLRMVLARERGLLEREVEVA